MNMEFPDLNTPVAHSASWSCPSNIALVKYWGKKPEGIQWPANASISWSLGDLRARTRLVLLESQSAESSLECYLSGERKPSFEPKIRDFLARVSADGSCPESLRASLVSGAWRIDSSNNFPHGTGIASSAAGFGALALCLVDIAVAMGSDVSNPMELASRWARLGSGSACRSVYADPAIWGLHPAVAASSDDFAVPFHARIHPDLAEWKDYVLIVDAGEKSVSSTQGHALLKANPYAEARYAQAQEHLGDLLTAMQNGEVSRFMDIVESEALQLHAMMMASTPSFILMRPGTLAIIEKIRAYREQSGASVCFTLDAGANVHLLFASVDENRVVNNLLPSLLPHCQDNQYLCSNLNSGPEPLNHE